MTEYCLFNFNFVKQSVYCLFTLRTLQQNNRDPFRNILQSDMRQRGLRFNGNL